jgi:DNA-binding NtrC family response regulator
LQKFIALSPQSKKILEVAKMSASIPANIIIIAPKGCGKKLLAKEILPDAPTFEASELEKLLFLKKINLQEFNDIVIYNLQNVSNKNQFLTQLNQNRIIATATKTNQEYNEIFAIKLHIPPLSKRQEDLNELVKHYTKEANRLYNTSITIDKEEIESFDNQDTLKQFIYKTILLKSLDKDDIMQILYNHLLKELKNEKVYKELLDIFEIPLLQAANKLFKSQLKVSQKLNISRNTLRNKLSKYFGG